MKLAVVTASLDPNKTQEYWQSWRDRGTSEAQYIIVEQQSERAHFADWDLIIRSPKILGVVPAFNIGVAIAAAQGFDLVACIHDDVRIDTPGWDTQVIEHFASHPKCVLAGFSGADGLGAENIYRVPYEPHQLARQGFFSNMQEAEKHGRRETVARRSACADGFSQIGRTKFMVPAFNHLMQKGIIHHAYDAWLGALASEQYRFTQTGIKMLSPAPGGECWFIPIACHHHGGITATGPTYADWAKDKGGDQGIWEQSHRKMYEDLRGILPIRVKP